MKTLELFGQLYSLMGFFSPSIVLYRYEFDSRRWLNSVFTLSASISGIIRIEAMHQRAVEGSSS